MNASRLDLALLQCLSFLIEEKSVSLAAKRHNLSQPAMSHALGKLRRLLGDPLLVRSGMGMELTARAMELHPQVQKILDDVGRLTLPAEAFDPRRATGRFVVVAAEYIALRLAPGLARIFSTQAPKLQLELRRPAHGTHERLLERRDVDLSLGWVRDPSASTRSKFLYSEPVVCIARSDHPTLKRRTTLPQFLQLWHVRAQTAPQSSAVLFVDETLDRVGKKLKVALVVPSHLAIGSTLAQSDLVTMLPENVARTLAAQFPLRIFDSPLKVPAIKVYMYWNERSHSDPRQRWLRQLVVAESGA